MNGQACQVRSYPVWDPEREIAESRYSRASTILSAQIEHSKWYELFVDPTIADAIMDRIIHNAYILPLDSKRSMRQVMAEEDKNDFK